VSRPRRRSASLAAAMIICAAGLTGCQNGGRPHSPSPPAAPTSAKSASAGPTGASTSAASLPPEPTTTNTLPPPPAPTAPAAKTAGKLTAKDLPVPKGWRTVARPGGIDEGYQGNGTWTHARDARYAAQAVITIGCAPITRDDYPDPIAALEGTYGHKGAINSQPGVGDLLQFKNSRDANAYYQQYLQQVRACNDPGGQVLAKIISSDLGLIDQRVYDGSTDWTEVARLSGSRLTLIILTDPGHKISKAEAEAILRQIQR
jgi:hypothetical protein